MHAKTKSKPRRISPLVVLLVVVLVAILGAAGWVGWTYWGSNVVAQRAAASELAQVRNAIANPTALPSGDEPQVSRPESGTAAWIMTIEAIGLEAPVIAGVSSDDLARGIGWYPGTSLPGQVGNFVVAGNRVNGGAFLRDVMSLAKGDEVVIDTVAATFTYTLIVAPTELTVGVDDAWVLDPIPGISDEVPTQAFLTLTTAEDLVPTDDRAVGFGILTKTETK